MLTTTQTNQTQQVEVIFRGNWEVVGEGRELHFVAWGVETIIVSVTKKKEKKRKEKLKIKAKGGDNFSFITKHFF